MLITELKSRETIASLTEGKKVFIINCVGCKEVHFPEKEAAGLQKELSDGGNVTGVITTDYICNPENMELRLRSHMDEIRPPMRFWFFPVVWACRQLPIIWRRSRYMRPVTPIRCRAFRV